VKDGTLRENTYGKDHGAYGYKWAAGVSKEQFEKTLKDYKAKINRL